ncbi:transcription factor adf-1 [Lasius niger]|uniref:Transcription factor adf-1 n=1 Tax=Lasius niger TaxID=67767 RepID=A0A0J7K518_LASNI|nr:transcription factor adf-1 [Lasius niger]
MKENSWRELALSTNMSVNDCRIRWTRLRERFGKEKRLRETTDTQSDSGAIRRPLFPFYESMLFSENHIKRRKTFTNVSSSKQPKTVN